MVLTTPLLEDIRDNTKTRLETDFTHGAIAEDTSSGAASDTELDKEFFRDTIDDFDSSVIDAITASIRLATTEGNNNTVRKTGMINQAASQVDNCDVTTGWVDSADMTVSVNSSEFKENNLALNLTKDAGAAALASTAKTTTSVDFTGKDLSVWLFIIDAAALAKLASSNAFIIRLGSDSGNYYQWNKDSSDLAVGWNFIGDLTSANADSTTGTPVIAALDYTFIGLTAGAAATTWSAGDFIMDDIRVKAGTLWTSNGITAINKTDDIQVFLDTSVVISVTEV